MSKGFRLRFQGSVETSSQKYGAYALKVTAYDPVGMTDKIFVYSRQPVNELSNTTEDVCDGLCSPVDIAQYPEDAPNPEAAYGFFRKNYGEWWFGSVIEALDQIAEIERVANQLRNGLVALETFIEIKDVQIGDSA